MITVMVGSMRTGRRRALLARMAQVLANAKVRWFVSPMAQVCAALLLEEPPPKRSVMELTTIAMVRLTMGWFKVVRQLVEQERRPVRQDSGCIAMRPNPR